MPIDPSALQHFRGIGELAQSCRFADCTHQGEPGCAVAAAAERGEVDPDAWAHYLRLAAEERRQVADHERRRRERVFGRLVRRARSIKRGEGRR